jgi:hypothetical protein
MHCLGGSHVGTPTDVHTTMGVVFSVICGPCCACISELNSKARSSRSTEESREWKYMVYNKEYEIRIEASHHRSEIREFTVEGIRLCHEDLVCDFTCAVVQ